MHVVLTFLHAALLSVGLFVAGNIALWLAWMGNPRLMTFGRYVQRLASAVPSGSTFSCKENVVSVTYYDPRQDEESTRKAYTSQTASFLTWAGGPRSAARIVRAAKSEMTLRLFLFATAFIPIIAFGMWLTFAVNHAWIFALLLFLEWQAMSAYLGIHMYLKYRFFSGLVAVVFLHETGWFHIPLWVSLLIAGIFAALTPFAVAWEYKDRIKDAATE